MQQADVTVVVPWRAGCPYRERSWAWLEANMPYRVVQAEYRGGTWVKALAVMPAIAALPDNDIVVVHDADVWCGWTPGNPALGDAIAGVRSGYSWASPHEMVVRLNAGASERFMAGLDGTYLGPRSTEEEPYLGVSGGGIVIARRDTFLDVPLDPRFVGWGQEDESWGVAMTCELESYWRGTVPLFHLWHPPQERWNRKRGSVESYELRKRYFNARYEPGAMRALIEEAKDALEPAYADVRPDAQACVDHH